MNASVEAAAITAPGSSVATPKTILLTDDCTDDIELLALMLKRSRILNPLQVVRTLADTICYLKGEGIYADRQAYPFPILLLLDLHLSDGSGFDVMRWVQAHPASAVRVVVLTGSDAPAATQSYELGALSFLTKPLRFGDFQSLAQNVRGITLTQTSEGYLLEVK